MEKKVTVKRYLSYRGPAYVVFLDGVDIGRVGHDYVDVNGWENVCWAAELGHAGFDTKQEAIDDLVNWYEGLVS